MNYKSFKKNVSNLKATWSSSGGKHFDPVYYEFHESDDDINDSLKVPLDYWETVSMADDYDHCHLANDCKLFTYQKNVPKNYVKSNGKKKNFNIGSGEKFVEEKLIKKKTKQKSESPKMSEFELWANSFNKQCEVIEKYELCTE